MRKTAHRDVDHTSANAELLLPACRSARELERTSGWVVRRMQDQMIVTLIDLPRRHLAACDGEPLIKPIREDAAPPIRGKPLPELFLCQAPGKEVQHPSRNSIRSLEDEIEKQRSAIAGNSRSLSTTAMRYRAAARHEGIAFVRIYNSRMKRFSGLSFSDQDRIVCGFQHRRKRFRIRMT
ncbi:hypothetical protein ACLBKU_07150 [Erythrobacter sp. NE805]|uniref:hypothetical protein n=1 Tax=Erythrobacter sp. NE805 TaxID=3389875 RepID=UPI00396AFCFD